MVAIKPAHLIINAINAISSTPFVEIHAKALPESEMTS